MIKINHVSKTFGSFLGKKTYALQDIAFEMIQGKTYALAGANGSGKSTLIACILGLYIPNQGNIEIDEMPPRQALTKKRVGYLPEHFSTYPHLTAIETLSYFSQNFSSGLPLDKIQSWLSTLELDSQQYQKVGTFSKGMKQRLGIILSLLFDPEIIIWDEPWSGLDPEGRKLVSTLLLNEKEKGKTILVSTHVLADLEKTCDHILILKQGKLILNQPLTDSSQPLEDLYLETTKKEVL